MNTNSITCFNIYVITIIALSGTGVVTAGNITDNEWILPLSGSHHDAITQKEYENEINSERSSNDFSSVVDEKGQVWDGMPLWRLVNRVNDTGGKAYSVTITGSDDSSATIPGTEIAGNDALILANAKNGQPIKQSDPSYPLVLAGRNLPIDEMVTGVSSLSLILADSN